MIMMKLSRGHLRELENMSEGRQELIRRYHTHELESNQCSNIHAQVINAPLEIVWSVVRRFERPQMYKKFIQSCSIIEGGDQVGSIREVRLISGIPATSSVERLEIRDDDQHVFSFRILGGGHRLQNYRSVTSLHDHQINGKSGTLLLESYVVNVPEGNTTEETLLFVDTVVRCNLKSLSQVTERRTLQLQAHELSESSFSGGAGAPRLVTELPHPSVLSHRSAVQVNATSASDMVQGVGIPPSNLQGRLAVDLRHYAAGVASAPAMGGNRGLMGQVDLKQGGAGMLAKEGGERTVEKSAAVSLTS